MSASYATAPTLVRGTSHQTDVRVTQRRILRSEWTKFRSLRSTLWTLPIAIVVMIGIGAVFCSVIAGEYHTFNAADRASFNATTSSLAGFSLAQLAIGVLGVLLISGEYSTGMIRASLTAVPRRLPVLWGKLAVFAGVVFSLSLVAAVISFYLGQSLLAGHHLDLAITAPGALRSVVGAALYVTVAGMIGLALGALLRNTAAAISAFVVAFFVIPQLTALLPASISTHFTQYLPSNAGAALYGAGPGHALSPWVGFAVLCGYAAILITAAAYQLRHRDA
jgi:ABC-2 type transport system permease protein